MLRAAHAAPEERALIARHRVRDLLADARAVRRQAQDLLNAKASPADRRRALLLEKTKSEANLAALESLERACEADSNACERGLHDVLPTLQRFDRRSLIDRE